MFYQPLKGKSIMHNLKAPKMTQKIGSLILLSLFMSVFTMQVNPAGLWQPGGQTQLVADAGWGFWQRRRPRTRLTSRGGVCAITPAFIGKYTVRHDRPLFTWKGESAEIITVRDYDTHQVIWSEPLNGNQQQVMYGGKTALEAGKLYDWQVLGAKPTESDRAFWTTFKIMPTTEQQAIDRDLDALSKQGSKEAILLEKADYFAAKNLLSDAVQVLYSVEPVSASFAEQRSSYVQDFCEKLPVQEAVVSPLTAK
jgi:hypothetical protein